VEEETTPLAVPKDDNTNETVLEEEKTPLAVPDKNTDKSEEEVQEDKVPLSLPKTGSQESMLYIILGMAIVVFGIKKYRK
jgi:LPXTG-motif cell wall anchor domain protein